MRGVGDVVTSDELLAEGPLVIHFFPFAFTGSVAAGSGCEAQVCGFGARLDEFETLGVRLFAVSRDSPQVSLPSGASSSASGTGFLGLGSGRPRRRSGC